MVTSDPFLLLFLPSSSVKGLARLATPLTTSLFLIVLSLVSEAKDGGIDDPEAVDEDDGRGGGATHRSSSAK